MSDQNKEGPKSRNPETPAAYDAPKIETVVTPQDLQREVQYAGTVSQKKL